MSGIDKHPHHVRHHITEQKADDQQGRAHQNQRIEQRQLNFLPRLLALLGVVGQLLQHRTQVAGMLARRHGGAVQLRESRGEFFQAAGQVMAFQHPRTHRQQHALNARRTGLSCRRAQGFLNRQRRLHQSRQLPGDQRQIAGGNATGKTEVRTCASLFPCARGFDIQRRQLAFTQNLPHLTRAVGFQHAFLLTPLTVEGEVFERGHYSSRVTRSTSSTVVAPSSTLRRPSSRMLGPRLRA